MTTNYDEIDRLQTTALQLHVACRRATSVRELALGTPSLRSLARVLPPMHDLDLQTIVLRAGLRLGLVTPSGR